MKVNLSGVFDRLDKVWVPVVVGELNGQLVKAAKFLGEYVWHHHENEDEMFLVMNGEIEIHFRDRVVNLKEGEFLIVPRGVEHMPVANELACVLLFEPQSTRNTGSVDSPLTIEPDGLERL